MVVRLAVERETTWRCPDIEHNLRLDKYSVLVMKYTFQASREMWQVMVIATLRGIELAKMTWLITQHSTEKEDQAVHGMILPVIFSAPFSLSEIKTLLEGTPSTGFSLAAVFRGYRKQSRPKDIKIPVPRVSLFFDEECCAVLLMFQKQKSSFLCGVKNLAVHKESCPVLKNSNLIVTATHGQRQRLQKQLACRTCFEQLTLVGKSIDHCRTGLREWNWIWSLPWTEQWAKSVQGPLSAWVFPADVCGQDT